MDNWLLWQLADSAFPAGGFAHSAGLEAAHQHGLVTGEPHFRDFAITSLRQAGRATLPIVAAVRAEPHRFQEMDDWTDAMLSNHVANRASRKQGQAMLASAAATFSGPLLDACRQAVRDGRSLAHLAPVFGVVAGALEIPDPQTRRLFLFHTVRGMVSAAVRLGIIGTLAGQRLTHTLGAVADEVADASRQFTPETAAQTAPILDMLHATHDRLYARLFQS